MSLMPWRNAQLEDVDALCNLVNSAYRGDSSRKGWTTEADLLGGQRIDSENLRELITAKDSVILLFEKNSRVCACVYLQKKSESCYLGMLTVEPTLQGHGTGRGILEVCEHYARSIFNCTRIEMTVIEARTELIAWYERRGYINTKKREPFPMNNPRFGLPKVAELNFVVLEKNLR